MRSNKNELILLIILILGLFLRIYDLGNESMWEDEVFSIRLANLGFFQIVGETSQDVHPPLYYMILHYWINLFGNSEFSTRFLSVIFGFFAIFMIYKVGSLIFDREVGILGSLILGLSLFHIHYSQEARMYSLMSLLTLLSIYFFIKLLKERSLLVSIGYILSSILLMYTHNYGLFIIIAQNIYIFTLFLLSREAYQLNFTRWILLQVILIVLFTPWINILIQQITRVHSGYWIPVPPITKLIGPFITYSGSKLLFLIFLILSSFSVLTYKKIGVRIDWKDLFKSIENYRWNIRLSNVKGNYLLLVWLLTSIILPFVISGLFTPIYITRYTIGASLAFYLLVGKGIINLNNKSVKLLTICIIIIFSSVSIWGYYTNINKERWREVVNYIETNSKYGDLLLFNGSASRNVFDYYSKRIDLIKNVFSDQYIDVNKENINYLSTIAEYHDRFWIILAYQTYNKGLDTKTLSKSYNLLHHKKYVSNNHATGKYASIEVYLFEKKMN